MDLHTTFDISFTVVFGFLISILICLVLCALCEKCKSRTIYPATQQRNEENQLNNTKECSSVCEEKPDNV